MNEQWEQERRQRKLVRDALANYRSGGISLVSLIESLESLSHEMTMVTDAWMEAFIGGINGLEETYAVALDRGFVGNLPSEFNNNANELIRSLEALMAELDGNPGDSTARNTS